MSSEPTPERWISKQTSYGLVVGPKAENTGGIKPLVTIGASKTREDVRRLILASVNAIRESNIPISTLEQRPTLIREMVDALKALYIDFDTGWTARKIIRSILAALEVKE